MRSVIFPSGHSLQYRSFLLMLLMLLGCFASSDANAVAIPLRDINETAISRDSLCGQPVVATGVAYFCAAERQIWQSDGSAEGTRRVLQTDGQVLQNATPIASINGSVYLTSSRALWVIDQATGRARALRDSLGRGIAPELLTDVEGEALFFRFNLGSTAQTRFLHELWKTDGTEEGTRQVKLFNPRLNPNDAAAVAGKLFFTNYEHELWVSDGTASGTTLLGDFPGRNARDLNNNLTNVDGILYFTLEDGASHRRLYRSDGTIAGTGLVTDLRFGPNSRLENLANVNGTLFFTHRISRDTEIWRSDGTAAGTRRVATLSDFRPRSAAVLGSRYLVGGDSLWVSDGTAAGTVQLRTELGAQLSAPHNGWVYFAADDNSGLGEELWRSDGTVAGTQLVRDIRWGAKSSAPQFFAGIGTALLFQANPGNHLGGNALWKTNGTRRGTQPLKDISNFTFESRPTAFTAVGNTAVFLANTGRWGDPGLRWSLWRSDGSAAGTVQVADVYADSQGSADNTFGNEYSALTAVGDQLYFTANDASGWAIWRVNPQIIGSARKLRQLTPQGLNAPPHALLEADGALLYFATQGTAEALWRWSPGENALTALQGDLVNPGSLSQADDRLFFSNEGDQLWLTDGSTAGTRRIKTLNLGQDARLDRFQAVGDQVIFRAQWRFLANEGGRYAKSAIWVTDGTAEGTRSLYPVYPFEVATVGQTLLFADASGLYAYYGDDPSSDQTVSRLSSSLGIARLTAAGNAVFYSDQRDNELWRTDGTATGTQRIASRIDLRRAGAVNGTLYFTAYRTVPSGGSSVDSLGLFTLDAAGTGIRLLTPGLWFDRALASPSGEYFAAHFSNQPRQIWRSDGTTAGTSQQTTLFGSSNLGQDYPGAPLTIGDRLYFVADDGMQGLEPWTFEFSTESTGSVELGDRVWLDANANGLQDDNEAGVAGVSITLEDCDGIGLRTTRSETNGQYRFVGLLPGDYQLRVEPAEGFDLTERRVGADYAIDSNADPQTQLISCRSFAADQRRLGLDIGLLDRRSPGAELGDRVWADADADGQQDADESGYAFAEVNLEDCAGNLIRTELTDVEGHYRFNDLPTGRYRVRFIAPAGMRFSPQHVGDDYLIDSDADPVTGLGQCRTVSAGQRRNAMDAGLVP